MKDVEYGKRERC